MCWDHLIESEQGLGKAAPRTSMMQAGRFDDALLTAGAVALSVPQDSEPVQVAEAIAA